MGIVIQSIGAGLATLLGAVLVLVIPRPGNRILASLLGLAGGIMIGVIMLDLVPSAVKLGNLLITTGGILLGSIFLYFLQEQFALAGPARRSKQKDIYLIKLGYLIAVGIALHDLPEGISIAAGFAAAPRLGLVITLAIALHNVPEGMITAVPLRMAGVKSVNIILLALAISIVTPLGTMLGLTVLAITRTLISPLLSIAAGAMAFIVFVDILPEAAQRDLFCGSLGTAFGFCLILVVGAF